MHEADALLTTTLERWLPDAAVNQNEATEAYRQFHRCGQHPSVVRSGRVVTGVTHEDGTRKFLLRHLDGRETESVIMPIEGRSGRVRQTLCLSSQVGCAMGCTFCQTATMGRVRNLTTAEIVAQWHHATHELEAQITNLVFMGMGEPMDNLDAVLCAIEVLTDHNAASIPPSRIGVSTVGHADGIRRFTKFMQREGMHQLRLAVSINAPNDTIRSEIMPINRAVPMDMLRATLIEWIQAGGRPVLLEYVLIPTINDTAAHAEELATWVGDLPCRLNVIPYNPILNSPWPAPQEGDVTQFIEVANAAGLATNRRQTRGRNVMAACGQLSTTSRRNR